MEIFYPASVQGATLRSDWEIFLSAALVVALVVYALILIPPFVWRRREADERLPPQFNKNAPLSFVYIGIPLLLVCALFYVTYVKEVRVEALAASPYATVNATAFRWSWRFDYPGKGISIAGTPQEQPVLVLPVNETTRINLFAADTTHSMWVPAFLFKRDAIPGYTNRFDFTPTQTGSFIGLCAQYCGLDHALMRFVVRVVPDDAYQRWLRSGGKATL
jgi:cytochrome c oxidase subunit 2